MPAEQRIVRTDQMPPAAESPHLSGDLSQLTSTQAFDRLAMFLGDAPTVQRHLVALGIKLAEELTPFIIQPDYDGTPLYELTDHAWQSCYDPRQPTLAFRSYQAVGGCALLAVAAQRLRQQGESICNVVVLPEIAMGVEAVDTTISTFFAQRGILFDADGKTYHGIFPTPVAIDCLTSNNNETLWRMLPATSFINEPHQQSGLDNKTYGHKQLADTDIPHARPLLSEVAPGDSGLHSLLADRFAQGLATVVKPTDGSIGRGVIMADPAVTSLEAIQTQLATPEHQQRLFVAEPWIKTRPLYEQSTGLRLDWNIRALVVNGAATAMYARVGRYGEPINASRESAALSIESVVADYGLHPNVARDIIVKVAKLSQAVGEVFHDAGLLGLDIILDQDLDPVLIEANGENSGGIINSIKTAKRRFDHFHTINDSVAGGAENINQATQEYWQPVYATVRALNQRLRANTDWRPGSTPHKDATSFLGLNDLLAGLNALTYHEFPADLPKITQAIQLMMGEMDASQQEIATNLIHTMRYVGDKTMPPAHLIVKHAYPARMAVEALAAQGKHATMYAPVNSYVTHDPTDAKRQFEAAGIVAMVSGANRETFAKLTTAYEAQSATNAQALGQALRVYSLLDHDVNHLGLSLQTLTALDNAFAEYFMQPLSSRWLTDVRSAIRNPNEWNVLAPVIEHIHVLTSLATGNHQWLDNQLRVAASLRLESGHINRGLFANEVYSLIRQRPERSAADHYSAFLATLPLDGFSQSYNQINFVPKDLQQTAFQELCSQLYKYVPPHLQANEAERQRLWKQLIIGISDTVVSPLDEAEASFAALEAELLDIYPDVYTGIKQNSLHYLEFRRAGLA